MLAGFLLTSKRVVFFVFLVFFALVGTEFLDFPAIFARN